MDRASGEGCPAHLKSFRNAVANSHSGKALIALAKKLRKTGYTLEGNHYKRYPRGFDADCVAAEFLLHDALYMVVELSPDVALQSNVLNVCLKHWKAALPLHRWLIEYV